MTNSTGAESLVDTKDAAVNKKNEAFTSPSDAVLTVLDQKRLDALPNQDARYRPLYELLPMVGSSPVVEERIIQLLGTTGLSERQVGEAAGGYLMSRVLKGMTLQEAFEAMQREQFQALTLLQDKLSVWIDLRSYPKFAEYLRAHGGLGLLNVPKKNWFTDDSTTVGTHFVSSTGLSCEINISHKEVILDRSSSNLLVEYVETTLSTEDRVLYDTEAADLYQLHMGKESSAAGVWEVVERKVREDIAELKRVKDTITSMPEYPSHNEAALAFHENNGALHSRLSVRHFPHADEMMNCVLMYCLSCRQQHVSIEPILNLFSEFTQAFIDVNEESKRKFKQTLWWMFADVQNTLKIFSPALVLSGAGYEDITTHLRDLQVSPIDSEVSLQEWLSAKYPAMDSLRLFSETLDHRDDWESKFALLCADIGSYDHREIVLFFNPVSRYLQALKEGLDDEKLDVLLSQATRFIRLVFDKAQGQRYGNYSSLSKSMKALFSEFCAFPHANQVIELLLSKLLEDDSYNAELPQALVEVCDSHPQDLLRILSAPALVSTWTDQMSFYGENIRKLGISGSVKASDLLLALKQRAELNEDVQKEGESSSAAEKLFSDLETVQNSGQLLLYHSLVKNYVNGITQQNQESNDIGSVENHCRMLIDTLVPKIHEKFLEYSKTEGSFSAYSSGVDLYTGFLSSFSALPDQSRVALYTHFMEVCSRYAIKINISSSVTPDFKQLLLTVEPEDYIDQLGKLVDMVAAQNQNMFADEPDYQFALTCLSTAFYKAAPLFPRRVRDLCDQLEPFFDARSLAALLEIRCQANRYLEQDSGAVENHEEKVARYQLIVQPSLPSELVGKIDYYSNLQCAYIRSDQESLPEQIRNTQVLTQLVEMHAVLPSAKQVGDVFAWVVENQRALAKVQMLFSSMNHANAFLIETARTHGFVRLTERLAMADSLSFSDLAKINSLLAKYPQGAFSSSTIYSLIALHSAFVDKNTRAQDVWDKILEESSGQSEELSGLLRSVSQELLYLILERLGIERSMFPTEGIENWNLAYLPRLIEGERIFRERGREADLVIYRVIIKATVRNEFAQLMHDHSYEVSEDAYTDEERQVISSLRDHNRLTRKRFESRGLDLDKFVEGTERRLTGTATAEQIVGSAYRQIDIATKKLCEEISTLPAVSSSCLQVIDRLIGQLDSFAHGAQNEQSASLPGIMQYYKERKQAQKPRSIRNESALNRSKDQVVAAAEQKQGISDAMKVLLSMYVYRKIPNPPMFAAPKNDQPELFVRFRKLPGSLKMKVAGDGSYTEVKDMKKLPQALTDFRKLFQEDDSLQPELRTSALTIIDSLQSQFAASESPEPVSSELSRPDLYAFQEGILRSLRIIQSEMSAYLAVHPQSDEQVNLILAHLRDRVRDIENFVELVKEARDKAYDVTITPAKKENPGFDIFGGCYMNCCVAIDNFNNDGGQRLLTGNDVPVYYIIDNTQGVNDQGNPYVEGGTFFFIGEDRDANLILDVDNIEVNPPLQFIAPLLRDAIFEIARESADAVSAQARISGRPGVRRIVMGDNYNDVPSGDLLKGTVTQRQVSGPASGLSRYLDVYVQHPTTPLGLDQRLMPTAFHKVVINEVPYAPTLPAHGEIPAVPEKPQSHVETEVFVGSIEERRAHWNRIKDQVLRLESETFGLIGDSPEELERMFVDPESIAVIALDGASIIGYSLGIPEQNYGRSNGKTLYVKSTAVDFEYQGQGASKQLGTVVNNSAKQNGYEYVSRDAMADTGYAQTLIRRAVRDGVLIEPEPVRNGQGIIDVEATIAQAEQGQYFNRPQIHVVTRL